MADKTFTSLRLKNKYDTYTNWTTNDPVLLAGEIALVDVSDVIDNEVEHVPSILMKVGNGTKKFSELDWVYAKASNVHDWALAADKPTYAANEITGLATYIDDRITTISGVQVDTDTQYTLTKVNDYQYKLMSKGKDDATFGTEVAVIDIPNDTAAITALQNLVGNTSVADQIAAVNTALEGRIAAIEGDYLKAADKTALEAADTALDGRVDTLETQILGLSGAMHFKGVEASLPADTSGYVDGDVILVGNKEYVVNNGAFVEFGDANAASQAVTDLTNRMTTAENNISTINTQLAEKPDRSDLDTTNQNVNDILQTLDDLQADLELKADDDDLQAVQATVDALADVATTGLWEDLSIGADTTIIIDCGTSAI